MYVTVDRDKCCGSGMCVMYAETVFQQDEVDGRVRVIKQNPIPIEHDGVRAAALACPVQAISIHQE